MTLWPVALRYLQQHRLRTVLTILAIVFGVAVIYGTNALLPAINHALETMTVSPDNPTLTLDPGFNYNASYFTSETLADLRELDGVRSARGWLSEMSSAPIAPDGSYTGITIIGVDPAEDISSEYQLAEGRHLQPGETRSAILSFYVTQVSGAQLGDKITLIEGEAPFEVVGLMPLEGPFNDVIIPLTTAQTLLMRQDQLNRIELTVEPTLPAMTLVEQLNETIGERAYSIMNTVDLNNASIANAFMGAAFNIFGALALFVGAFLIFITFSTAVIERKRDLAMLRAIGATGSQIRRLLTLEALLQGIAGTFIGLILGQIFAILMLNLLWGVSYQGFAPPSTIPLNIPALLIAVVVGLLTALGSGYLPARAASRIAPLDALRPSNELEIRRVARARLILGLLALIVGIVFVLIQQAASALAAVFFLLAGLMLVPVLIAPLVRLLTPLLRRIFPRIADLFQASLLRQPWRTAATVNLMMVGFAIFSAVVVLMSPIQATSAQVTNSNSPDTDFVLIRGFGGSEGIDPALTDMVADIPGVARISTQTLTEVDFRGRRIGIKGVNPSLGTRMDNIFVREGEINGVTVMMDHNQRDAIVRQLSQAQNIIVNYEMAGLFNLKVGDTITLDTATGPKDYSIIGIASDFFPDTGNIGALVAHSPQDFPDARLFRIMVGAESGQLENVLQQVTSTILVDEPEIFVDNVAETRARMLANTQRGLSLFYVLAIIVLVPSLLGLVNTLIMSVLERTREIGLLRASGASQRQIHRMIVGEGLLLGLVSAVIGILVGMGMGYALLTAYDELNTTSVEIGFFIPMGSFGLALLLGLGLILLATLSPARRAARMDILDALRAE